MLFQVSIMKRPNTEMKESAENMQQVTLFLLHEDA